MSRRKMSVREARWTAQHAFMLDIVARRCSDRFIQMVWDSKLPMEERMEALRAVDAERRVTNAIFDGFREYYESHFSKDGCMYQNYAEMLADRRRKRP